MNYFNQQGRDNARLDQQQRIIGGYSYIFIRVDANGETLVRCKNYFTSFCAGTGRINPNGEFFAGRPHNHQANPELMLIEAFRTDLFTACVTQFRPLDEIYNRLAILHREAALRMPLDDVIATMRQWRDAAQFPGVVSIFDIAFTLRQQRFSQLFAHQNGAVDIRYAIVNDQYTAIIFGDIPLINQLINSEVIYISTKRNLLPVGTESMQILSVATDHKNHAFPILWAIMTDNSVETYSGIFNVLFNEMAPGFRPQSAVGDFDENLIQGLILQINNIEYQISFESIYKILLHKATTFQIDVNDDMVLQVIKKFIGLSLLPVGEIIPAFESIVANLNVRLTILFDRFIQYYRTTWLGTIGPARFSLFEKLNAFHNASQLLWLKMDAKVENTDNFWRFSAFFYMTQIQCWTDLSKINERKPIYYASTIQCCLRKKILKKLWPSGDAVRELNHLRFLETSSNIMNQNIIDYLLRGIENVNELVVPINVQNGVEIEEILEDDRDVDEPNLGENMELQHGAAIEVVHNPELAQNVHDEQNLDRDLECMFCMDAARQVSFIPCGHRVVCVHCANFLRATADGMNYNCFICDTAIEEEIRDGN